MVGGAPNFEVYQPDVGQILNNGQNAFAAGQKVYQTGVAKQAGQLAAGGDYTGARNAFFQGGNFDEGAKVQGMIDNLDDRQRAKAKETNAKIGQAALYADTPEKWTALVSGLQSHGIDVSKYQDFGSRNAALAESGMMGEYLARADKQAAMNQPHYVPAGDAGALNEKTGELKAYPADARPKKMSEVESRARAAGLVPGTLEYQDYVLNGPEKAAGTRNQIVSPGQRVITPEGKEVYAAPGKDPNEKHSELYYRAVDAGYQPGTKEFNDYVAGGPPKTSTEKWNGEQSKAANFGHMMIEAEKNITSLAPHDKSGAPKIGPDGQPLPTEMPKGIVGAVREGAWAPDTLKNLFRPETFQLYRQAAKQWIGAKLRKESGAAISPAEEDQEFQRFFPQYGDGPDVQRQKAAMRAEATRGMIAESSGAYDHFFGPAGGQPAPAGKPVPGPRIGRPPVAANPGGAPAAPAPAPAAASQPAPDLSHLSDEEILQAIRGGQ